MIRGGAARIAALAGVAGLALVPPFPRWAVGVGALAVLAAHPSVARALSRFPWGLATAGAVLATGLVAAAGEHAAVSLGLLLVYLQVHAHLAEAAPRDERRPLVLSALMIVTAAGATQDPWFGPLVVGWALALPVACLTGPVRAGAAAGVAGATLALSAGIWVLAPRARPEGAEIELTGFTAEVELGTLDALLDDPRVVVRVTPHPAVDEPIYWRGVALDTFDGRRWSSGSRAVSTRVQPPRVLPPDVVVFDVEPDEPGVVLTAGWPLALDAGPVPLYADGHGVWSVRAPLARYRLVAQGPFGLADRPITPPEVDDALLAQARALPADLDPRIAALAAQVAGEGRPIEQVRRLADHLRARYAYTRTPHREGTGPLSVFLFEQPAGHCEYFATALAVLARTRGIPSRLVNGFVGGERDPVSGAWTLRRKDAHTWVEVYDRGWWRVDATPGPSSARALPAPAVPLERRLRAAWDERIVAFDREDQVDTLVALARATERLLPFPTSTGPPWGAFALLGAATLGAGVLVSVVLRRWESRRETRRQRLRGPVARAHRRARQIVAERGWSLPESAPPVEAGRRLCALVPGPAAEALLDLAWLYYATSLGREDPRAAKARARALLREVARLPRRPEASRSE